MLDMCNILSPSLLFTVSNAANSREGRKSLFSFSKKRFPKWLLVVVGHEEEKVEGD